MKKRTAKFDVATLARLLDTLAPRALAEPWDNVGLLLGDPAAPVATVLVALEASAAVVAEARRRQAQALVLHHPPIFKGVKRLLASDPAQRVLLDAAAAGVALLAEHTNLDKAPGGTPQALADRLDLENRSILFPECLGKRYKFVVFVPRGHETAIIEAVGRAGAGVIGDYSHCTFRAPGTGTYIPLDGASPFAGAVGRLEHAEELRLECVVERGRLDALLREVRAAHPYEEMAFDVVPLEETERCHGYGLLGDLPKPTTLRALARRLGRETAAAGGARFVGDPERSVSRVALATGSGGDALGRLAPGTADVFVTGEIDHHEAFEARESGRAVVCVGHYESEVLVVPYLAAWLRDHPAVVESGVRILESEAAENPWHGA